MTEDEDFWDSPAEKQAALKTLTKAPPRLFSAGLNAVVTEWDTTSLKPKVWMADYRAIVTTMSDDGLHGLMMRCLFLFLLTSVRSILMEELFGAWPLTTQILFLPLDAKTVASDFLILLMES